MTADRSPDPPDPPGPPDPPPPALQRLRRGARLLDSAYRIPGTRIRFGWDALVGLLPGAGDLVGAAASLWIVVEGLRLGAPGPVVARMLWNVAVETVVGTIPLFGDLLDVAWKANLRNVELLERSVAEPDRTRRRSGALLWVLGAGALLVIGLAAAGVLFLVLALGGILVPGG